MSAYFPISDYDKGITLSKENAERLFEDAKMLFEAKKSQVSYSLSKKHGVEQVKPGDSNGPMWTQNGTS